MHYTPHEIAVSLRGDGDDPDVALDLERCLARMPAQSRALLVEYGKGYSEREACRNLGITGNEHRKFVDALRLLTKLVNGGDRG